MDGWMGGWVGWDRWMGWMGWMEGTGRHLSANPPPPVPLLRAGPGRAGPGRDSSTAAAAAAAAQSRRLQRRPTLEGPRGAMFGVKHEAGRRAGGPDSEGLGRTQISASESPPAAGRRVRPGPAIERRQDM